MAVQGMQWVQMELNGSIAMTVYGPFVESLWDTELRAGAPDRGGLDGAVE